MVESDAHVHRWQLDEGLTNVPGRCACGESRVFGRTGCEADNWGGAVTTSAFRLRDPALVAASRARGGVVGGASAVRLARAKKARGEA